MVTHEKNSELAQWLSAVLTDSIVLPQSVRDYMSGTFGDTDLAHILETGDSSEIDSLLELLFYPDVELKTRFETHWGNQIFDPQDLEAVIELVCNTTTAATVITSADDRLLHLDLPCFVIDAFIRRLNIVWKPTAELKDCLAGHAQHNAISLIRVHLRHARLDWHANQVSLVDRYLAKVPSDADHFESDLQFLLEILPELSQDSGHYDFLTAKKFFFFQSLCKAEDFERKRLASNMETMMLQGNRAAHGNIDQWRQQMRQIDGICQALFGRTQFFQQPSSRVVDLGQGATAQYMDEVIKQLS